MTKEEIELLQKERALSEAMIKLHESGDMLPIKYEGPLSEEETLTEEEKMVLSKETNPGHGTLALPSLSGPAHAQPSYLVPEFRMLLEGDESRTEEMKDLMSHLDVDQVDESSGASLLYFSAQEGKVETVNMLIEKKADINKQKEDGAAPLFIAAQENKPKIIDTLIEKKAAVNLPKRDGATPLYIAAQEGNTNIIRKLLEAKAKVDHTALDGWGPLMVAAWNGQVDAVSALLKAGAGLNLRSNLKYPKCPAGLTVFEIADIAGRENEKPREAEVVLKLLQREKKQGLKKNGHKHRLA